MLKRAIFLAAALAASAAPASAATVWVGNVFVTAAASVCGASAAVGDYATLIYRPASVPLGNGANSYLAYVSPRSSFAMTVPNNTFRPLVNYAGQFVSSTLKFGTSSGGITAWTMTPATLSATTTHAQLTTTLANFFATTGCTVTLRGDLELAP